MNSYPQRVDDILRFISDFTIYVDGVGDVCRFSAAVSFLSFLALIIVSAFAILNIAISLSFNSLSLFDFKRHGNRNYGSPFNGLKSLRSSQGKMEKSFLRYMQFQVLFIFFTSHVMWLITNASYVLSRVDSVLESLSTSILALKFLSSAECDSCKIMSNHMNYTLVPVKYVPSKMHR